MIKPGTLCYVRGSKRYATTIGARAVGHVVTVDFGPYSLLRSDFIPGDYYTVRDHDGLGYTAHHSRLVPIADPDADVTERRDEMVTA